MTLVIYDEFPISDFKFQNYGNLFGFVYETRLLNAMEIERRIRYNKQIEQSVDREYIVVTNGVETRKNYGAEEKKDFRATPVE